MHSFIWGSVCGGEGGDSRVLIEMICNLLVIVIKLTHFRFNFLNHESGFWGFFWVESFGVETWEEESERGRVMCSVSFYV